MKNKCILLIVVIIIILIGAAIAVYLNLNQEEEEEVCQDCSVENFEDCVANGNAIMESYPRQCRTADGRTFTENIGNVVTASAQQQSQQRRATSGGVGDRNK